VEFRRQHLDDVKQGNRPQRGELPDADVRRDGRQHGGCGTGARQPLDEAREIEGELAELAGADETLAVVDIGMDDRKVGHHAAGFAG
jgi:hypothetical protein